MSLSDKTTYPGITYTAVFDDSHYHVTVSEDSDGNLFWLNIKSNRKDSDVQLLLSGVNALINLLISSHVQVEFIIKSLRYLGRSEKGTQVPNASSILDYVAQILNLRYRSKSS